MDSNKCERHKNTLTPETFKLRIWIIEEGLFYNSRRNDTGVNVEQALPFKIYPYNDCYLACDFGFYLQNETRGRIGMNLFADDVLTNAKGELDFTRDIMLQIFEVN